MDLKANKEYLVFNAGREWKPMKMFLDLRGVTQGSLAMSRTAAFR